MKLFLIGAAIFSGSGAVAMQNEEVRENVGEMYKRVQTRVRKQFRNNHIDEIAENGFPYPNEDYLNTLTEEQQLQILTTIDQINATYNWSEMTNEEIADTLLIVKEELSQVYAELGLEVPQEQIRNRFRNRINKRTQDVIKNRLFDNLKEEGLEYPNSRFMDLLDEDQQALLISAIDEFNETYDWANMTDEEIVEALIIVREELRSLHEEFGIFPGKPINDEEVTDDSIL